MQTTMTRPHGLPMQRRRFVAALAAGAAAPPMSLSLSLSFAAQAAASDRRLVLVVLRGGLDGLAAVPAIGDPAFAEARGALAQYPTAALPLTGPFALHPALAQVHAMFGRGEAAVVHATGLPYRERSHFDAQQVLESGGSHPHQLLTGWLARALASDQRRGIALNTAVPLVLRGPGQIDTWAPSTMPEPTPDLVARLEQLYLADPALAQALARAKGLRGEPAMAANAASGMAGMAGGGGRGAAVALARKAAEFISAPGGPQAAVLEMNGWDSHANQAAPNGALSNNLGTLDAALATLRDTLSAPSAQGLWSRTVVLVVTEFGREVAANGTLGTDHGSGGAALLLGGAVKGGQVIADWPGLARADRFEGRDLRITTDLRAVFRTVLHEHLQLPLAAIDRDVFPGSAGLRRLELLRG